MGSGSVAGHSLLPRGRVGQVHAAELEHAVGGVMAAAVVDAGDLQPVREGGLDDGRTEGAVASGHQNYAVRHGKLR